MAQDTWTTDCDSVCGSAWSGSCVVVNTSTNVVESPDRVALARTFHCLPSTGSLIASLTISSNHHASSIDAGSPVYGIRHIGVDWTKLNVTTLILRGVGDTVVPMDITFNSADPLRGLSHVYVQSISHLDGLDLPPLPATLRSLYQTRPHAATINSSHLLQLSIVGKSLAASSQKSLHTYHPSSHPCKDLSNNLLTSISPRIYALKSLTHL
ncbi:hypothetical protein AaE_011849 [Aphanomyces astaci]|uniref:Uncharacterized protein n=1 Tax=Aphanomyces astaci TaxID=112090 RepID=A0A6A4ZGB1_APHAT|nr:hypothetical protein AaE_011849 [Aphanomyces astaci]